MDVSSTTGDGCVFHNGRWMDVDEYLAILEDEYWDAYDATHEDDGSEIYD